MAEDPFADRLKRLEDRLSKAHEQRKEPERRPSEYEKSSLAWRMVIELVVGMALGVGIGYGLDELFGTRPVFLVIFALLGFGAGVRTMLRTADEVKNHRAEGALLGPKPEKTKTDPEDPR
ncbi:MAG: F0F1 ATP synthase subunit I [Rhodovulum sulfidophilum]|uniref:ATP synthase protein I n=1 Tax=Rhodovulum sulfidophilum TaxID=35806 RepID=A0A2W5Q5J4_RHOSU|nr:MAG: F0F1 ATP synthase subunit I [Rhodovulum sulfidophilum]